MQTAKQWIFPQPVDENLVQTLMDQLNLPRLVTELCVARGYTSKEAIQHLMTLDASVLHDPYLFAAMPKIVARLQAAIAAQEPIIVCGDYDVDGMSGTTIVLQTLRSLGAQIDFIIPNRFIDGYGLNERIVDEAHERGATIIITVDNGIAALDAVAYAKAQGIDVIITDHHDAKATLPDAFAILHPKYDETYPFAGLSGGGVAFKLAQALLPAIPDDFYAYAALSTVADMVPLVDENHYLVKRGLQVLQTTTAVGLKQLIRVCGLSQDSIDEESIGFYMGPRMNAAGRLDDASIVVELFMTDDEFLAEDIANELQSLNEQRQQLVNEITAQAIEQLSTPEMAAYGCLVHASTYNHQGVAGIVATRLMHHFGKPVISLVIQEESQVATGSARAFGELHLMELLTTLSPLLTRFGGHKHAAGLTLPVANIEALQTEIQHYFQTQAVTCTETVTIDVLTTLEQVNVANIEALALLAPFGIGNQKPVVCVSQVQVSDAKTMGSEQNHLKMQIVQLEHAVDVVGFQQGNLLATVQTAGYFDVIGTLNINTWRNVDKPQLMLETLRANEREIHYCEQPAVLTPDEVYLEKVPAELPELYALVADKRRILIHPRLYQHRQLTRRDFIIVYRLLQTYQHVTMEQLALAAHQQCQLPKGYLNSILTVFSELKFVIISDGVVQFQPQGAKVELEQSSTYRLLLQKQALATILRHPNTVRLLLEHGIEGESE